MSVPKTKVLIKHVLGNVFTYYSKNISSLAFLFLIVAGPFSLAGIILSCYLHIPYWNYKLDHPENSLISLGYYYFVSFLPMFVSGLGCDLYLSAIVFRQEATNNNRTCSLVSCIFSTYRRIGSILILSVLVGLIVWGGFLLLIVPGIFLWLRYCVSVPILISENKNFTKAMRRSRMIVYGNRPRIFLLMVIVYLGYLALYFLANSIGEAVFSSSGYAFETFTLIVHCFLNPLWSLVIVYLYRELKTIDQNSHPRTDEELIQQTEPSNIGFIK